MWAMSLQTSPSQPSHVWVCCCVKTRHSSLCDDAVMLFEAPWMALDIQLIVLSGVCPFCYLSAVRNTANATKNAQNTLNKHHQRHCDENLIIDLTNE